ncbi:MAG: hypothetical protein WAT93_01850 [Pontixanthobacter sp.]
MKNPKILFLFNHDAAHQAAHIAGIMESMATRHAETSCVAGVGSPEIEHELRKLLSPDAAKKIVWADLSLGKMADLALALPNRIFPARRLARLRTNEDFFGTMDIIVSTERTCLRARKRLRARYGDGAPKFAYVPHGSGDRNVAYHPALAQFDIMLLSGKKLIDEMVSRGLTTPEQCHLIGYPKFDAIDTNRKINFFDNDLPTFVYNPHFDPKLSSWYDHGPELLKHFAKLQDQFNLIFAPHVMLFRKSLHISLEYRVARRRPDVPEEAYSAPNILVDLDGPRLFDMSYTLSAGAYIGDMSSQIYEFLLKRRPAFFIDTHSVDLPSEEANRAFWQNGPVVRSVDELMDLLPHHREIGSEYRAQQDELFQYTIDNIPEQRSVDRAADVLANLLKVADRQNT